MLNKFKFTILILFITFISNNINAQNSLNSPYSMFGIGELSSDFGYGRSKAMGGVSTPLYSNLHLNPNNPASYTAFNKNSVVFEVGINAKSYTLKTENNSYSAFDGNIAYIALGIPINKWWKAGFGLKPISSVNYNIQESSIHVYNNDSTDIINLYKGEGGLNSFYVDNSFKITKNLSLGIKSSYIFGSVDKIKSNTSINNVSSTIINQEDKIIVNSFAFSSGVHYHKLINDNLFINIGATFNLKSEINAKDEKFVTSLINTSSNNLFLDTLVDETIKNGVLELPQSFSSGLSVIFNKKYEIAFDYNRANWSDIKFFNEEQNLTNFEQFAAGFEFLPDYRSIKFYKAIRYRIGANVAKSYLLYNNKQLRSYELSLGVGLPIKNSRNILNFTFSYGSRYIPNEKDLLSETYYSFNLNFSLHAFWFQKRLLK